MDAKKVETGCHGKTETDCTSYEQPQAVENTPEEMNFQNMSKSAFEVVCVINDDDDSQESDNAAEMEAKIENNKTEDDESTDEWTESYGTENEDTTDQWTDDEDKPNRLEEYDETEDEKREASKIGVIQLSDTVFILPDKKMSNYGNVFAGEIRSGEYGVRVCTIQFSRKLEQNAGEIKILTKLASHANVISILQSGIYNDTFEDRFYIVLDEFHHRNLQQHITHQRDIGVEFYLNDALEYSKQIIAGVTCVHENKILHKDLKPSGIFLSCDKRTIKLADFSSSQEIKSTSSKIYSKIQFGTNGFRPIESFGNNWVSLKSDIFSLGVVLYFVLSNGKSPFGDENSFWIHNMRNGVIDLSHLLVPNANTFQHLIESMLANERCRRPSIWQVADHPCWNGKEVECNFDLDYGCVEETYDCEVDYSDGEEDSSESELEIESHRQLFRALKRMGFGISTNEETSIVIYDRNCTHLQRFSRRNKSLTQMHEVEKGMMVGPFTIISLEDHIYVLKERSMFRLKHRSVTARWDQMADLVADHGLSPPTVAVWGAIYVAGSGFGQYTKSASKYFPSLNRWKNLKDKRLATDYSVAVACRGHVYSIGGEIDAFLTTNRVERFNEFSQSWSQVSPMQEARKGSSAIEYDERIFVAGGLDPEFQMLYSVEKYDPDIDQWTTMKPMIECRAWFRCHLIGGNTYAVGGDRDHRTIEKYDLEKNEWDSVDLPEVEINIQESVVVYVKK